MGRLPRVVELHGRHEPVREPQHGVVQLVLLLGLHGGEIVEPAHPDAAGEVGVGERQDLGQELVLGVEASRYEGVLPEGEDLVLATLTAHVAGHILQKGPLGVHELPRDPVHHAYEHLLPQLGMRIVGPNCLGVFNLSLGWFGTFANTLASWKVPSGPIGIVTQSGAYGGHLFTISQNRGVGTNYWVTTGNEVDVDVSEVIGFYATIDNIKVIISYAEGIKDGESMCRALHTARKAEKPIIFMKVGGTEAGARAAASHTASLAGQDAVYDGLLRQYGVYRAETTEEMADIAYICQFGRYPKGNKICLQTISGGIGVQLADAASKRGFDVEPLPEKTQKKILKMIPFAGVNNPVDFTGQVLNERRFLEDSMRHVIDDGDYDSHILYMASLPISQFTQKLSFEVFSALRQRYPDELMLLSMIGTPDIRKQYEEIGYPCFEDHSLAVRAAAALRYFGLAFERGTPDKAPALPSNVHPAPDVAVSEYQAKRIIASAGIPVAWEILCADADACVAAWSSVGKPVVMKIASPDLPHKTEIGGVLLSINDEDAIREGHATLLDRARVSRPDAEIDGVIVAEMVSGGVETMMGVVRDPTFGAVVMFGLGGVFVEILKDVTFRVAPFGIDEARRMIDEIRGRGILDGVRGTKPADLEALADALSRLSVFAAANADKVESIDVNPFIVLPKGAAAVDALIVPRGG